MEAVEAAGVTEEETAGDAAETVEEAVESAVEEWEKGDLKSEEEEKLNCTV